MASQVTSPRRPKAKRKGLVVEEAGGEVLVYNRENDHVHSLNDSAARIWRLCTGRRTVEQIASELDMALDPAARQTVVRDAVAQFERLGLVEPVDGAPANPSRRRIARRISIGVAAGVALPLIVSLVAPTPAFAGTVPDGGNCTTSGQCKTGCCCADNAGGHHFLCESPGGCNPGKGNNNCA